MSSNIFDLDLDDIARHPNLASRAVYKAIQNLNALQKKVNPTREREIALAFRSLEQELIHFHEIFRAAGLSLGKVKTALDNFRPADVTMAQIETFDAQIQTDPVQTVQPPTVQTETVETQTDPLPATAPRAKIASPIAPQPKSWADKTTASRPSRPKPTARRVQAAFRAFQEVPADAPKGFGYLYVARSKKMSRAEIRRSLRTVGLDTSRILDISFPVRGMIGLLVHSGYAQTVLDTFTKAGVKVTTDLNPTDPAHLADPKYQAMSPDDRAAAAIQIHANRCIVALRRLRPYLVPAVGHCFVENGWILAEDVTAIIHGTPQDPPDTEPTPMEQ